MVQQAKKTPKMLKLEAERGRSIEEILTEEYRRLGTQQAVAKELGISVATVWMWLYKRNIQPRRWAFPDEVKSHPLS